MGKRLRNFLFKHPLASVATAIILDELLASLLHRKDEEKEYVIDVEFTERKEEEND